MTLHIEIGEDSGVQAGMTGVVLRADSGTPVPGGDIKITKDSGRYCIATTSLSKLGKKRWVRINVR